MDSPSTLTLPILKKGISTQNSISYLRERNSFSKEKIFHVWKNQSRGALTMTMQNMYPKISYIFPKEIFQAKKIFTIASENQFSTQRKNFLYLVEKLTNFPPKEKFLIITRKNNFVNKNFLIFKNLKCFFPDVFWILHCYVICYQNLTGFLTN